MQPKTTWLLKKQKRALYLVIAALCVALFVFKVPAYSSDKQVASFKDRETLKDTPMLSNMGNTPGRKSAKSAKNTKDDGTIPSIKDYTKDIAKKLAIEKATKEAIALDKDKNKPVRMKDAEVIDALSTYSAKADFETLIESSPVVIFSKSYCPYSKKLKTLLSTKYKILPSPTILELDLYEHGKELQDHIGLVTKRKTVPNLIVNGFSYGGCDDIVALDEEDKLLSEMSQWLGQKGKISLIKEIEQ